MAICSWGGRDSFQPVYGGEVGVVVGVVERGGGVVWVEVCLF